MIQVLNLEPNGYIKFIPNFIDNSSILEKLVETLPLKQENLNFGGKETKMPRLVCWHGDEGKNYTYSRKTFYPNPWTDLLLEIKEKIENLDQEYKFNSCLVNYYRDGMDSIGWHADNEKSLGKNPLIASISFGSHRNFEFKNIANSKLKFSLPLGNGDLLIMGGDIQHNWLHGIKKTSEKVSPRINLTFRKINDRI